MNKYSTIKRSFPAAFLFTIPILAGFLFLGIKNVDILSGSHGIPELIAVAVVAVLHLWKRQMLLSILGGTVAYMLLIQLVF